MQLALRVRLSAQQLLINLAGTIPAELEGTLLRNGPGLLEIGGKPLSQPLDGDGMVYLSVCMNQWCSQVPTHCSWGGPDGVGWGGLRWEQVCLCFSRHAEGCSEENTVSPCSSTGFVGIKISLLLLCTAIAAAVHC